MSDKPSEKKADDAHGDAAAAKKGGIGALLTKLPVLLGGVMAIEAVVLLGAFKAMGGGAKPAEAAELHGVAGEHGPEADDDDPVAPAAEGAKGGEGHEGAAEVKRNPKAKYALPLIEFRAPNKVSGRMYLFDVSMEVLVTGANFDKVKARLDARKALISDRVRTIIAQSDPDKLNGQAEPGLETLKRQVKFQLDQRELIGDGLIDEVVVPRCIPFRADF